jgi:hypothetical protein
MISSSHGASRTHLPIKGWSSKECSTAPTRYSNGSTAAAATAPTGYGIDTGWAVSVDLVIVAMMFWVLSGLWMWWEMKVTRRLGALAALGGAGLFAFYLLAI